MPTVPVLPPTKHLLPSPSPSLATSSSGSESRSPPPPVARDAGPPGRTSLKRARTRTKSPLLSGGERLEAGASTAVGDRKGKAKAVDAGKDARGGTNSSVAVKCDFIDLTLVDSDSESDHGPAASTPPPAKKARVDLPLPPAPVAPPPPPPPPRPDRLKLGDLDSLAPPVPPPLPKTPIPHYLFLLPPVPPAKPPKAPRNRDSACQPPKPQPPPASPGRLGQAHSVPAASTVSPTPQPGPPSREAQDDYFKPFENDPTYLHHLDAEDTREHKDGARRVYRVRAAPSTARVHDLREHRDPTRINGRVVTTRWSTVTAGFGLGDEDTSVPDAWGGHGRILAAMESREEELVATSTRTIGFDILAVYAAGLDSEEEG